MRNLKYSINSFLTPANFPVKIIYLLGVLFFLLYSTGCGNKPDEVEGKSAPLIKDSLDLQKTLVADSGIAFIAFDRYEPLDSVPAPEVIQLTDKRVTRSAYPNRYPAGKPSAFPLPENLTVITPGKDGVPLPKVVLAKPKVVPAKHPETVTIAPPRYIEGTILDLQILSIDFKERVHGVNLVFKDSRGDYWFGSNAGAIRYDGKNIQLFSEKEGMIGPGVLKIIEDRLGRMWFVTYGSGITCYDGLNFIQYNQNEGLLSNAVLDILEDRNGKIWVATSNGISCFDGTNFTQYTQREGLINTRAYCLREDSQGNLWIGLMGSGGAYRFDGVSFTYFTPKDGLAGSLVYCIMEDDDGNLWFGTGNGVSCFDGKSFRNLTPVEGLVGNLVRAIEQDDDGRYWIVSTDGSARTKSGLTCYDGINWTRFTEDEGLSHNRVRSLYKDAEGKIWAPASNGINIINLSGTTLFSYHNGLNYEQLVSDIVEDHHGNLWMGTWGNGFLCFDKEQFSYFINQEEHRRYKIVNKILLDKAGDLWFDKGTYGVNRFNGKSISGTFLNQPPYLRVPFLMDKNDRMWMEVWNGLAQFDGKGYKIYLFTDTLKINKLSSVIQDNKGNVWLSTDSTGILRFDGNNFTHFTDKEGLYSNNTNVLLEDSRGNIWIGSNDKGLCYFDGKRFETYSVDDGLCSNLVYNLTEDKNGVIWAACYNGVSLLVKNDKSSSHTNEKAYKIYQLTEKDGLKGKDLRAIYIDSKNIMWLGSEKGLMSIDLNKFKIPSEVPEVHLTDVSINQIYLDFRMLGDSAYHEESPMARRLANRVASVIPYYNVPTTLKLPSDLNHLTFHFSATDWSAPHKTRYSFYMEGVDKIWSTPQEEPSADYRNLTYGKHTFRVKAMGASQIWSKPFEYSFTIYPPWYYSTWAYSFYILALGLLYFSIRRYELNRQKAKSDAERLRELDQVKTRLYTNITHEFRTPLTLIIGLAEQLKEQTKGTVVTGLEMIHRNGKQLLHLVNQMLELSKLESGSMPLKLIQADIILYLKYLTESFQSAAVSKQIALRFQTEEKEFLMDFDADKLQKITTNLLSNALKFTPEGGEIVLDTLVTNGDPPKFTFSVGDSGPGIPEESLPFIFDRFFQADDTITRSSEGTGIGLALTRELVKLLDGNIKAENQRDSGARFMVSLPVHNSAPLSTSPIDVVIQTTVDSGPVSDTVLHSIEADKYKDNKPILLVVEDNPDVVSYLVLLLEKEYHIKLASNGRIGLNEAMRTVPDLIISDVMMPEMDGFELCRMLKKDKRTSHIPIVLLTAKADIDSRIEGLEQGADAYLAKPFEERELRVQLRKLHELRQALRERYNTAGMPLPSEVPAFNREDDFFRELYAVLESNFSDQHFGVPELAKAMAMSRPSLYRKLTSLTGKNIESFLRYYRLQKAHVMLKSTDAKIQNIAWDCGFKDAAHFTRAFQEAFDVLPSDLRA
ncbi:MAG: response regulator [Lewinellaceae bacterium]|nr:response regulator [Saprospiraceae bacterium]MCB9343482.1 response regulator [Lewinellaceae bacterium]